MELSKRLEKAFNDQVGLEYASAYQYLAMAAYFESIHLSGFANWMTRQYEEETAHARKFFDYLLERGGAVDLPAIPQPISDFKSPRLAFEKAMEGERRVTASIRSLYELASKEKDYASFPLLEWFLAEQVEEEDAVGTIVERLRLVGDDGAGLLLLDQELGAREA